MTELPEGIEPDYERAADYLLSLATKAVHISGRHPDTGMWIPRFFRALTIPVRVSWRVS